MKVKIHPNTVDKIKSMISKNEKDAIRIKACSAGWTGLNIEVILDEQHDNDDVVIDNGIKTIICRIWIIINFNVIINL